MRKEMCKWWGSAITKGARINAQRVEGGTTKTRWFIGVKEVCRNFYLRARGIHHEHARKIEIELLEKKHTVRAVVEDRALKKQKENKTELVIKDWLVSYSRRFNEQSSTEHKVTVLPFLCTISTRKTSRIRKIFKIKTNLSHLPNLGNYLTCT